jgi:uncharacterized membrane-anchored protein
VLFSNSLGTAFGDFLTKPVAKGGLDLGTLFASIVSLILKSILIFISHIKMNKVEYK